jgi:hypothetical protein
MGEQRVHRRVGIALGLCSALGLVVLSGSLLEVGSLDRAEPAVAQGGRPAPPQGDLIKPSGGQRVEVRPGESYVGVVVEDKNGRPVLGAPVAPVLIRNDETVRLLSGAVRTDEHGRVRICVDYGTWGLENKDELHIEVVGIFDGPLRRRVSSKAFPGPLRFTLPPTGRVRVHFDHQELGANERRRSPYAIGLRVSGTEPAGNLEATIRGALIPLRDSVAEFSFVQAGLLLTATLQRGPSSNGEIHFGGPTEDGQIIAAEILGDRPALTGRMVSPNGVPLVGYRGTAHYRPRMYGPPLFDFVTGDGGRVQWGVLREGLFPPEGIDCLYLDVASEPPNAFRQIRVSLPRGWQGTTPYSMGVISLLATVPLAEGVVVDGQGEPVSGARITVLSPTGRNDTWPSLANRLLGGPITTSAAGKYSISVAEELDRGFKLQVRATGYQTLTSPLQQVGQTGLRLVMSPGSSLTGSVLLRDNVEPTLLRLEAGSPGWSVPEFVANLRDDGSFKVSGMAPGEVEARIVFPDGTPVAIFPVACARAGGGVDLGVIDLRNDIFGRTVQVSGSDGSQGLPPGHAVDRRGAIVGIVKPSGVLQLMTSEEFPEVTISVPGYLSSGWITIEGDERVILETDAREDHTSPGILMGGK